MLPAVPTRAAGAGAAATLFSGGLALTRRSRNSRLFCSALGFGGFGTYPAGAAGFTVLAAGAVFTGRAIGAARTLAAVFIAAAFVVKGEGRQQGQ